LGPGGQAGSTSIIENYAGFPDGVSGRDLVHLTYLQELKLVEDGCVNLQKPSPSGEFLRGGWIGGGRWSSRGCPGVDCGGVHSQKRLTRCSGRQRHSCGGECRWRFGELREPSARMESGRRAGSEAIANLSTPRRRSATAPA
jgi:hypothetical protein